MGLWKKQNKVCFTQTLEDGEKKVRCFSKSGGKPKTKTTTTRTKANIKSNLKLKKKIAKLRKRFPWMSMEDLEKNL